GAVDEGDRGGTGGGQRTVDLEDENSIRVALRVQRQCPGQLRRTAEAIDTCGEEGSASDAQVLPCKIGRVGQYRVGVDEPDQRILGFERHTARIADIISSAKGYRRLPWDRRARIKAKIAGNGGGSGVGDRRCA